MFMRVSVEEKQKEYIFSPLERCEFIPFEPLQKENGGALVLKKDIKQLNVFPVHMKQLASVASQIEKVCMPVCFHLTG